MKYVLYCIFEQPRDGDISAPSSDGRPLVQLIESQGLCAAIAETAEGQMPHNMNRIMQYHRVIEWFFRQVSVIPFRFGTVLDTREDLESLWGSHSAMYREILTKIDGCSEMGIRAIWRQNAHGHICPHPSDAVPRSPIVRNGKQYLSSRKAHYCAEELNAQHLRQHGESLQSVFAGLFRDFKTEPFGSPTRIAQINVQMFSAYFLVPNELSGQFRERFIALEAAVSDKLLLSGPWPPYNFVLPSSSSSTSSKYQSLLSP